MGVQPEILPKPDRLKIDMQHQWKKKDVSTLSQYRDMHIQNLTEESELDNHARQQETEDAYEPVGNMEQLE